MNLSQGVTETTNKREPSAANDCGCIENIRRPRGRPLGSKNKPKPPVIITCESQQPTMSPYVLEIPANADVITSITSFCMRRCSSGLCILNGSGSVANVTLKQPSASATTVTFHGRFDMLSMSGTILPSLHNNNNSILSIYLAGPRADCGRDGGGAAGGVGTVYVVAASFSNPMYHRLSVEEGGGGGGGGGDDVGSPLVGGVSGGGDSEHAPPSDSGGGMGVYGGGQMNSDVI